MSLDPHTAIAVIGLLALVFVALAIAHWSTGRTYPGYSRWMFAVPLLVVSLLLVTLWPNAQVSLVLANAGFIGVSILCLEGARAFRGLPSRVWLVHAGAVGAIGGFAFFLFVVPNLNVRSGLMAAVVGVNLLLASITLLRGATQAHAFGLRLAGSLFGLFGLAGITRAVYSAFGPPLSEVSTWSGVNGAFFLGLAVLWSLFSVGFLLLADERAVSDLQEAKVRAWRADTQVAQHREAEAQFRTLTSRLKEYERAVEGAEEMIAVVDRDYRYLIANRRFLSIRNMTKAQVVGHFVYEIMDQEAFEVIKERLDESFQGEVVRYEMKYAYPTVGERDILVSYFPIEDASGDVDRVACILQDITDRKRTEEELASVTHRLILAQEEERTRLARDLHDDLAQRMVGVAMQLHSVARVLPSGTSGQIRLQQACDQVSALSQDIQSMSHRLHSSHLEYLGLEVAVAGFCQELSEQHHLKIDFAHDGIPVDLPKDIALCLFRVLQEALTNALKHSKSREFQVLLWGSASEIDLFVHDSGIGFDAAEPTNRRGLGLTSMRERLKLVDGELSIDSKPARGTTVHARVPQSMAPASASVH